MKYAPRDRIFECEVAETVVVAARDFEGPLAVRVEDKRQGPPKLHDLLSHQKLCASRFATPTLAATDLSTSMRRWRVTSAATADAVAEERSAGWVCWRGNADGLGCWNNVNRLSLAFGPWLPFAVNAILLGSQRAAVRVMLPFDVCFG